MNPDPPPEDSQYQSQAGPAGPSVEESRLVAEMAELAAATLPEGVFLEELLKRALMGVRGEAGAVWMCDAQRRLVLQSEICLEATGFLQDPALRGAAEPQFAEIMRTGGAMAFQIEQQLQNGTARRRSLFLGGLQRDAQVAGLVQVFEGPGAPEEQRPLRLQFLGQLCGAASRFWKNRPEPIVQSSPSAHPMPPQHSPTGNGPTLQSVPGVLGRPRVQAAPVPMGGGQMPPGAPPIPAGLPIPAAAPQPAAATGPALPSLDDDEWVLALHGSQNVDEVALVGANECRRLLGADRVSVAEQYGPRVKIQAVSGQQSVSARSNAVRLLSKLTEKVLATGEKLSFTGDTEKFPPQFEALLADYLLESRSRVIIILPVFGPKPWDQESQDKPEFEKHLAKPAPVGGIVVEQISESPLPADLDERLQRIGHHVGLALRNAQSRERVFLLPLWQFLGNWKSRLKGRKVAQSTAVLVALLTVVLALVLVPWNYRVSGKGRMMPIVRRGVFAPNDGEVINLVAKSGDEVEAGELLVELKNEELRANLLKQKSLLAEKKQTALAIESRLNEREIIQNRAQEIELRGQLQQTREEIIGAQQQVEVMSREVESLRVCSPIAGVVATFRLEELLRARPVKRGELLLEVMDTTRAWRLEVDVPENRIGHIIEAQQKLNQERLPVSYMLATATESTYDGTLESLSNRSVASESEGTVVPVYVALADPSPPAPRIGAEVKAKIDCGKASLGYVLFGDVVEFLRKYLWL
jgi:multidrug efflux pump subunit AcrA (membrane-fusion protein)